MERYGSAAASFPKLISQCFATDILTVQFPNDYAHLELFRFRETLELGLYLSGADYWFSFSGEAFAMGWDGDLRNLDHIVASGHREKTDATAPPAVWPSPAKQPSAASAQVAPSTQLPPCENTPNTVMARLPPAVEACMYTCGARIGSGEMAPQMCTDLCWQTVGCRP
jgi:hypothetical protein